MSDEARRREYLLKMTAYKEAQGKADDPASLVLGKPMLDGMASYLAAADAANDALASTILTAAALDAAPLDAATVDATITALEVLAPGYVPPEPPPGGTA